MGTVTLSSAVSDDLHGPDLDLPCAHAQGMRFEITKPLNQNFFLSHSLFMGNMELGTGGRQVRGRGAKSGYASKSRHLVHI